MKFQLSEPKKKKIEVCKYLDRPLNVPREGSSFGEATLPSTFCFCREGEKAHPIARTLEVSRRRFHPGLIPGGHRFARCTGVTLFQKNTPYSVQRFTYLLTTLFGLFPEILYILIGDPHIVSLYFNMKTIWVINVIFMTPYFFILRLSLE